MAGDLRITYSQFEELESFSRFGTRLDEHTRARLERGWRVREILKQQQYKPLSASEQIAALLAVISGVLDKIPVDQIADAESRIRSNITKHLSDLCSRIESGGKLTMDDHNALLRIAGEAIGFAVEEHYADY